jgi:hypothetical protein
MRMQRGIEELNYEVENGNEIEHENNKASNMKSSKISNHDHTFNLQK